MELSMGDGAFNWGMISTVWSGIIPPKEPDGHLVLDGVSLGSHTSSCPEKHHPRASSVCYCLSSRAAPEGRQMGLGARGWLFLTSLPQRVLRVPTATPESLPHSGVSAAVTSGGSLTDRACLLREHRALLILSDALSPPGLAIKASHKGGVPPEKLKLWCDKQTLK